MNFADWPQPFYVVDIEGNGADPPDLVEVAAVPISGGRPQPGRARQWLIRPPVPIPDHIARIHGITDQMTADAPTWPEIAGEVRQLLEGAWIAAHNVKVDHAILARHLPDWRPAGVFDTLRLARATWPGADGYSLDALLEYAAVDLAAVTGARHRAGYDAHAAAVLLTHLAAHYPSWDAMAAKAVPPGMPGLAWPEEDTLW